MPTEHCKLCHEKYLLEDIGSWSIDNPTETHESFSLDVNDEYSLDINYCPLCGRKLTEMNNNGL